MKLKFTIEAIEYEKTFLTIYPQIKDKLWERLGDGLVGRLLAKMGSDSERLVVKLLGLLNNNDKNTLVAYGANNYKEKWLPKLQEALVAHKLGRYVQVGDIVLDQEGGNLAVYVELSNWDAKLILQQLGGLGGLTTAFLSAEKLNKLFVQALDTSLTQATILAMINKALKEQGIYMQVSSMQRLEDSVPMPAYAKELPEDLKERLLEAGAGYMRKLL